jgi:hypothetical protein
MNYASATLTSRDDGKTIDKVKLAIVREDPPNHKIKGSNNGTWGVGMSGGALFPVSMNGPLGYRNFPLPNYTDHPTLYNAPAYNAPAYNGPAYNQPMIKAFSGFTFDGPLNNQAPIGESASVLIINPNMS